ncbi:Gfo/Idh/MocA family protein [Paenibacillus radicis (ex Xue et al. 2023)]|uniref:Gfo/Idh/MocA family oxidoreductase n=1 Tax=Paenibacillus radicis (ex Xue et al. 2023) TaxID=2972489 RepID=A0ABT1YTE3_9BACL|nr:Gfo/Idh/MocA family oxidoreductase [Paenibacillus radicis (ex Xue et al. 2023)]MCR8636451.1 Gfo/Idh/MocA family oxidoreductase [Paenibacillus radicis (ex Xue et al. 2023)]
MQSTKQISLGIIGMGKVTVQRHIPSIRSINNPNVQLVAVADAKPGLAAKIADDLIIPYAFEDYKQLLAMDEINTVSICTPTFTHAKIAIDALQAGKNVYLEKPATMNEAEMRDVMKAAKESGKVFIVGSNGMLQNQMLMFKRMIDNKELGEVFNVSITRSFPRGADSSKRKTIGGDGISMESASHNVEWALFFLGDPKPVSVTGLGYYKYDNISIPLEQREEGEVDDCSLALIQFDNGSSFMYKAMRSAAAPAEYEVSIQGDMGLIKYDVNKCYKELSDDCIRIYTQHEAGHLSETRPLISCGKTHAAMYKHFFECIAEGKESYISNGERSVVVMKVLDALKLSMKNKGKQIILD